jgi:hypothetical protein
MLHQNGGLARYYNDERGRVAPSGKSPDHIAKLRRRHQPATVKGRKNLTSRDQKMGAVHWGLRSLPKNDPICWEQINLFKFASSALTVLNIGP